MNPGVKDYFEPEGAIVARIRAAMPQLVSVLTPFDISDMKEASQPSPAVHVVYTGDSVVPPPAGAVGRGAQSVISQRWLVVLAVRNAKAQLGKTEEIRKVAGPLIPPLLETLQGWAPVEWMRPLSRVGGPPPGFSATFAYFPFMFEGRFIT